MDRGASVSMARVRQLMGLCLAWIGTNWYHHYMVRLMSVQMDGQTPLHAASSSGNGAIVEDLIAAQAVVDATAVRRRIHGILLEVEWSHLG